MERTSVLRETGDSAGVCIKQSKKTLEDALLSNSGREGKGTTGGSREKGTDFSCSEGSKRTHK